MFNKNHIKNSYVQVVAHSIAVQVYLLPEEKIIEGIDTTEENERVADDFGFSVAGVDFILHSRRYAYVAGVRHLRDETTTI